MISEIHQGELAGLGVALVGAVEGVLIKALGFHLPAVLTNASRCTVAALVTLAIVFLFNGGPHWQVHGFLPVVISVFLPIVIGDTCYFAAVSSVGVGIATAIAKTFPVFTVLFAFLLLGQRITLLQAAGMALAITGTVVLSRASRGASMGLAAVTPRGQELRGVWLAVMTAFVWGLGTVALGSSLRNWSVADSSLARMALGAAFLWPIAVTRSPISVKAILTTKMVVINIVILGVALTASGLLLNLSVALAGAGVAAACCSMAPLFAAPLGAIVFKEPVTVRLIVGLVFAVAGVLVITTS